MLSALDSVRAPCASVCQRRRLHVRPWVAYQDVRPMSLAKHFVGFEREVKDFTGVEHPLISGRETMEERARD